MLLTFTLSWKLEPLLTVTDVVFQNTDGGCTVSVGDGDAVGVAEGVAVALGDGDGDALGVGLALGDGEGEGDGLGLALGDGDGDGDALGEGLALGEGDGDAVAVAVGDGDAVAVGVTVGVGVGQLPSWHSHISIIAWKSTAKAVWSWSPTVSTSLPLVPT
jgi:hypothetical protein